MFRSNRYKENFNSIDRDKEYSLSDAVGLLKDSKSVKFDETVDMAVNLGVDPKHADQIVRGTVALPNGIGKDIKVLVFAKDNLAEEAEKAGADAIHVSAISSSGTGVGFTEGPLPWEKCQYSHLAKTVQSAVNIPVIAVGRIEPEDGEKLIAENSCGFVAMGRQLLADPELPNNLINNSPEKIRPCINCFVCVAQNFWNGEPVCAVNARLGDYETETTLPQKLKNIVIVGGGPAGLECARIAASRGHKVTLLEQMKKLGGTALFSSLTTPKNGDLIKWFERVLEDSEVEIRKGFHADRKSIMSLKPDAVVIATGSRSPKSGIKGSDLPHVLSRDQHGEGLNL